jgi:predicted alpha/beta-fold hydrolase
MPLIIQSDYASPPYLFNGHLQTIVPAIFRKVEGVRFRRERISTPDNDFLDLDWSRQGFANLAILSHGLEGDSHRPYIKGMVRMLNAHKWDALAWNYRGCSGEMNRQPRFYHSGATDDLDTVIQYALNCDCYETVALIGFSLGGNLTLKYLGEKGKDVHQSVRKAAVFSVPLCLSTSSDTIAKPGNFIYSRRFLKSLHRKVQSKSVLLPDHDLLKARHNIRSIRDFDDLITAPLHGFDNAAAYYAACSAKSFLKEIAIPTLIVNAKNDPFLSEECLRPELAEGLEHVYLETPREGGHCGFAGRRLNGPTWSEKRALAFLKN